MKKISITVDRKIGYIDDYKNIYGINYGYIPNTIAEDGEEQDAYIVGINYPVETFSGYLLAVIHRNDDIEEKYVIAKEFYCKEYIEKKTEFIEKYFDSFVIMKLNVTDFISNNIFVKKNISLLSKKIVDIIKKNINENFSSIKINELHDIIIKCNDGNFSGVIKFLFSLECSCVMVCIESNAIDVQLTKVINKKQYCIGFLVRLQGGNLNEQL